MWYTILVIFLVVFSIVAPICYIGIMAGWFEKWDWYKKYVLDIDKIHTQIKEK